MAWRLLTTFALHGPRGVILMRASRLREAPNDQHTRKPTLHETNIAPKNGWLEYSFPFGKAYFQVRAVSFREGKVLKFRIKVYRFWGHLRFPPGVHEIFCLGEVRKKHLRQNDVPILNYHGELHLVFSWNDPVWLIFVKMDWNTD